MSDFSELRRLASAVGVASKLARWRRLAKDVRSAFREVKPRPAPAVKVQRANWLPFYHLAALIAGRRYSSVEPSMMRVAPSNEEQRTARNMAREVRLRSIVAERLHAGDDLGAALVEFARESSREGRLDISRPALEALASRGSSRMEGTVACGVLAARHGLRQLAWDLFAQFPPLSVMRLACREYFAVAYFAEPAVATQRAQQFLQEQAEPASVDDFVGLFEAAFGARDYSVAAAALGHAEVKHAKEMRDGELTSLLAWYRRWIDYANRDRPPQSLTPGRSAFAILSYEQPDLARASANLGDYTQTVASLGHLVRHKNAKFHGDPALVDVVQELQGRVKPARVLDSRVRDVDLHIVRRDASSFDSVPPGTWALAFGWYMHSIFDLRYDFPLNPDLRPIFVSFHVSRRGCLTPAAIEYLKAHGPIGCRDWATTYLLLSAGVEAFFSGCLTTTIEILFPEPQGKPAQPLAEQTEPHRLYIDTTETPDGAPSFKQAIPEVRTRPFAENIRHSVQSLEWYRDEFDGIVTSRLHSCLPARTIGIPVEFRAKNPVDVRFEGLIGISDQELVQMRERLSEKIASVMELMLSGVEPSAVYQRWAEVCSADVALAKERFFNPREPVSRAFHVNQECQRVQAARVDIARTEHAGVGSEVHIEVSLDGNLKHQLEVVVDALEAHSARPLHLYVLSRDLGPSDHDRLARLFPKISFSWLPCDEVDYGAHINLLGHISIATMDRLLLPNLLPDLDRIIHLDLDTLPLDDIGILYDVALNGAPLAGRPSIWEWSISGVAGYFEYVKRLKDKPSAASDSLRLSLKRQGFDFPAFNAGVLLLDLARMRQDKFCETFFPYVEEFGLHDQHVINLYAGANRAPLDRRWNAFPRQEVVKDPAIIHWAGPGKPWSEPYVLLKELWQQAEQRLAVRQAGVGLDAR